MLRLGDEQVDLAQLAVEARRRRPPAARTARPGVARRGDSGGASRVVGDASVIGLRRVAEVVIGQSSGIRIQPWRIAYTTAWVRSLTDSLRRIELMWFLTVCSLIDSA